MYFLTLEIFRFRQPVAGDEKDPGDLHRRRMERNVGREQGNDWRNPIP